METNASHVWRARAPTAAVLGLTLLLCAVLVGCTSRSASDEQVTERGDPLKAACQVLKGSEPLTIGVLGDSTGNDGNEWVALWAQRLGEDHQVSMLRWNEKSERWDRPALKYGTTGSEVKIWNFSVPGRKPEYASNHIDLAVPIQPDLILFNFGHNNVPGEVRAQYEELVTRVRARWPHRAPEVIIVQNPEVGDRARAQTAVRSEIRSFAASSGIPVIDVSARFDASGNVASLMSDGVHPNEKGYILWEQAVSSSLCMT